MKYILILIIVAVSNQFSYSQKAWFEPDFTFPKSYDGWVSHFNKKGVTDKIEGIYDVTYVFKSQGSNPAITKSKIAVAQFNGNILHFTISKEVTAPEYRYIPLGGSRYHIQYALAEMSSDYEFEGTTRYSPTTIEIIGELKMDLGFTTALMEQKIKGEKIYTPPKNNLLSEVLFSSGTGFFVDNKHIVTNYHVIEKPVIGKKTIKAIITTAGNSNEYLCEVVSEDMVNDLAILKINGFNSDVKTISFSSEQPSLGMKVYTLGYPMSSSLGESIKLSEGVISSEYGYKGISNSFQLSIPLNPGNSGGPLFTDEGDLIGVVNSGILKAQNISYAIKLKFLKDMLDRLGVKYFVDKQGETFITQIQRIKNQVTLLKVLVDK